jgi:hypothetical protein
MPTPIPVPTPAPSRPDLIPPGPDPDFLDQALETSLWALQTAARSSSEKLADIGAAVAVFAVHHWMLLTGVAAVAVFSRRFAEWRTVGAVILADAVKARYAAALERHAQARQFHENAWLGNVDERAFQAHISALEESIRSRKKRCDLLFKNGSTRTGRSSAILFATADRYKREAEALQQEIDRLTHRRGRVRTLKLVNLVVTGADPEATGALGELNKLWRQVDWASFIPRGAALSDGDRQRVLQLLQTIASTVQLGEARTAFGFLEKLLTSYGHTWKEAA